MPADSEPRTKAGRELLEREAFNARSFALITTDAILAIEAEAARLALEDVAERVRGLYGTLDAKASREYSRAIRAVLVLLDAERSGK